jgi:Ser/Thr protein kinase RdoA (MazF antagonist)
MNLADALSEHGSLEEINGMLLSGDRHSALRRELSALLSPSNALEHCHVRHARFRPGHKLRANFDVDIRTPDGARHSTRAIEVTWRPPRSKDHHGKAMDLGEMQEEALRRGVAAPFCRLVADLPALGMSVKVSPLDSHFPQLVRMSDPNYVGDVIARISSADDARKIGRLTGRYKVTCIRYRPGRRHVLRYDCLDSPERGTLFAKMYAGENAARASHIATAVADWFGQFGEGITSLRPLAYLPEDAVVLYRRILGEPLSQRLQNPSRIAGKSLRAVGLALRALHKVPQEIVGPLKLHDLAAEIKQIKRSGEHLPTLLPSAGDTIKAMLARATELDERLPKEQPTFAHGDFISEHIWVASAGLVLIDFDNCVLADPALDIGKFLADLELVYTNHCLQGVEEAKEVFLAGYRSSMPVERMFRARLFEAIKLVKMAARRVYVFERDWAFRTAGLIARAQALMTDLEHTLGMPVRQVSAPERSEGTVARNEVPKSLPQPGLEKTAPPV